MERICVYTGGMAEANGYLVKVADDTYIAIDAPEGFTNWIRINKPGAKVTDLLITHQHFDHVQDAARMQEEFGTVIHAQAQYSRELTLEDYVKSSWGMGLELSTYMVDDIVASDGPVANQGDLRWVAYHVPGHSPDSIVYGLLDEGVLFTGDVLFAGSVGRTDFPDGSMQLLIEGIQQKIMSQSSDTVILPGHGPRTAIKNELLTNPFIS